MICKNRVTIDWLLWVMNCWIVIKLNVFYCYFVLNACTICYIFFSRIEDILSIRRMLWVERLRTVSDWFDFAGRRRMEMSFCGVCWVSFYRNVKQLLSRQMCLTAMLLPFIFYIFKAFFSRIIYFVAVLYWSMSS